VARDQAHRECNVALTAYKFASSSGHVFLIYRMPCTRAAAPMEIALLVIASRLST
jgi:hypothetical protein